eukprot:m.93279 g.93279  ORF g.93279 m.93279 type:complete len:273 (-) comp26622_c0_seq1:314-1132(-)
MSVLEYRELLDNEESVDIDQLKVLAVDGIPNEVREEVWLYMLGVLPSSKAHLMQKKKALQHEYDTLPKTNIEFGKQIAFDVQRQVASSPPGTKQCLQTRRVKNVLTAYVNRQNIDYDPSLAHLISPLAMAIKSEVELYGAFRQSMEYIYELEPVNDRGSKCLALFRAYLPELHQHFEDEEVNFITCVSPWLKGLLSLNLDSESVLILWDAYLSRGFWIHPYVCISCLNTVKEELEELEQQDIQSYLNFLHVDVDKVLVEAEDYYNTSRSLLG